MKKCEQKGGMGSVVAEKIRTRTENGISEVVDDPKEDGYLLFLIGILLSCVSGIIKTAPNKLTALPAAAAKTNIFKGRLMFYGGNAQGCKCV